MQLEYRDIRQRLWRQGSGAQPHEGSAVGNQHRFPKACEGRPQLRHLKAGVEECEALAKRHSGETRGHTQYRTLHEDRYEWNVSSTTRYGLRSSPDKTIELTIGHLAEGADLEFGHRGLFRVTLDGTTKRGQYAAFSIKICHVINLQSRLICPLPLTARGSVVPPNSPEYPAIQGHFEPGEPDRPLRPLQIGSDSAIAIGPRLDPDSARE